MKYKKRGTLGIRLSIHASGVLRIYNENIYILYILLSLYLYIYLYMYIRSLSTILDNCTIFNN